MRIAVLGGTRFIGRAITCEMVEAGHDVLVVHRGQTEPDDLPEVQHLHVSRADLAGTRDELHAFRPEGVVDTIAMAAADADTALEVVPADARLVVLSSMDVYRAYVGLMTNTVTDAVPVDETSPVREQRYPYRGQGGPGMDDYEKLDVEERYLARGGTVCRLPMVYGERDGQRREEFILRRVRAGRPRIPFGPGNALLTRGYVDDVARGVRLALESIDAAGEIFNLGERSTASIELWARMILEAAGADAELVPVPDDTLPEDLGLSAAIPQHLLCDSRKARHRLGWQDSDPRDALRRSVAWHLEHPPTYEGVDDFSTDEAALTRS